VGVKEGEGPMDMEMGCDERLGVVFKEGGSDSRKKRCVNKKSKLRRLKGEFRSFKMIFRFPPEERRDMLLAVENCKKKKQKAKFASSFNSNSFNSSLSSKTVTFSNSGDWKNWMTLHDLSEVTVMDVFNIAEKIGVNPKGSKGGFFVAIIDIQEKGPLNGPNWRREGQDDRCNTLNSQHII
jgi:hypothetical protein